jgi:hypothetical protein
MGFLDQVKTFKASAPTASRSLRERDSEPKVKVQASGIVSINGPVLDAMGYVDADYIPAKSEAAVKAGRSTVRMAIAHSADSNVVLFARPTSEVEEASKQGLCQIVTVPVPSGNRNNAQIGRTRGIMEWLGHYDSKHEDGSELRANIDYKIADGTLIINERPKPEASK